VIIVGEYQIADQIQDPGVASWSCPQMQTLAQQMPLRQQEEALEEQFSWMTDADKHMFETELTPVPWEKFEERVYGSGETHFKAIE
jgi:hypothetical protein